MPERLDHLIEDFIWDCRRIIEDRGSTEDHLTIGVAAVSHGINPNGARGFRNDVVTIVCEASPSLAMAVTRVANGNPVLCLDARGTIYRQHMEFQKIADHVALLCRWSLAKRLGRMSPDAGGHGIISLDHANALRDVVDAAKKIAEVASDANHKQLCQALDGLTDSPFVE